MGRDRSPLWHHANMETRDLLHALDRDSAAFVEACEVAGLTIPIAACPGWTVADLLWHLTEVHHFWRTIVADQRQTWEGYEQPHRPVAEGLPAMFRHGRDALLETLRTVEPDTAVWTWSGDHRAGWVIRRMAQETALHGWDATEAAGMVNPLDPQLASDGIDEFLASFIAEPATDAQPVGGSVHIHCGDVPGEWTIREDPNGGFDVTPEHAKGDCAIRGTASDILLALWRRLPLSVCDVVGDADVAARFVAHSSLQ
jgi:uncharacterized protein (TIGR03083 family)